MDLYEFRSGYAQVQLGRWLDRPRAVAAFDAFEQAFDAMPWTGTVLASLVSGSEVRYSHVTPDMQRAAATPHDCGHRGCVLTLSPRRP